MALQPFVVYRDTMDAPSPSASGTRQKRAGDFRSDNDVASDSTPTGKTKRHRRESLHGSSANASPVVVRDSQSARAAKMLRMLNGVNNGLGAASKESMADDHSAKHADGTLAGANITSTSINSSNRLRWTPGSKSFVVVERIGDASVDTQDDDVHTREKIVLLPTQRARDLSRGRRSRRSSRKISERPIEDFDYENHAYDEQLAMISPEIRDDTRAQRHSDRSSHQHDRLDALSSRPSSLASPSKRRLSPRKSMAFATPVKHIYAPPTSSPLARQIDNSASLLMDEEYPIDQELLSPTPTRNRRMEVPASAVGSEDDVGDALQAGQDQLEASRETLKDSKVDTIVAHSHSSNGGGSTEEHRWRASSSSSSSPRSDDEIVRSAAIRHSPSRSVIAESDGQIQEPTGEDHDDVGEIEFPAEYDEDEIDKQERIDDISVHESLQTMFDDPEVQGVIQSLDLSVFDSTTQRHAQKHATKMNMQPTESTPTAVKDSPLQKRTSPSKVILGMADEGLLTPRRDSSDRVILSEPAVLSAPLSSPSKRLSLRPRQSTNLLKSDSAMQSARNQVVTEPQDTPSRRAKEQEGASTPRRSQRNVGLVGARLPNVSQASLSTPRKSKEEQVILTPTPTPRRSLHSEATSRLMASRSPSVAHSRSSMIMTSPYQASILNTPSSSHNMSLRKLLDSHRKRLQDPSSPSPSNAKSQQDVALAPTPTKPLAPVKGRRSTPHPYRLSVLQSHLEDDEEEDEVADPDAEEAELEAEPMTMAKSPDRDHSSQHQLPSRIVFERGLSVIVADQGSDDGGVVDHGESVDPSSEHEATYQADATFAASRRNIFDGIASSHDAETGSADGARSASSLPHDSDYDEEEQEEEEYDEIAHFDVEEDRDEIAESDAEEEGGEMTETDAEDEEVEMAEFEVEDEGVEMAEPEVEDDADEMAELDVEDEEVEMAEFEVEDEGVEMAEPEVEDDADEMAELDVEDEGEEMAEYDLEEAEHDDQATSTDSDLPSQQQVASRSFVERDFSVILAGQSSDDGGTADYEDDGELPFEHEATYQMNASFAASQRSMLDRIADDRDAESSSAVSSQNSDKDSPYAANNEEDEEEDWMEELDRHVPRVEAIEAPSSASYSDGVRSEEELTEDEIAASDFEEEVIEDGSADNDIEEEENGDDSDRRELIDDISEDSMNGELERDDEDDLDDQSEDDDQVDEQPPQNDQDETRRYDDRFAEKSTAVIVEDEDLHLNHRREESRMDFGMQAEAEEYVEELHQSPLPPRRHTERHPVRHSQTTETEQAAAAVQTSPYQHNFLIGSPAPSNSHDVSRSRRSLSAAADNASATLSSVMLHRAHMLASRPNMVEVSSMNKEAASRAAEILQLHHKYIQYGSLEANLEDETWTATGQVVDPDDDEDNLEEDSVHEDDVQDGHLRVHFAPESILATPTQADVSIGQRTPNVPGSFPSRTSQDPASPLVRDASSLCLTSEQFKQKIAVCHTEGQYELNPTRFKDADWSCLDRLVVAEIVAHANRQRVEGVVSKSEALLKAARMLDRAAFASAFVRGHDLVERPDLESTEWDGDRMARRVSLLVKRFIRQLKDRYPHLDIGADAMETSGDTNVPSTPEQRYSIDESGLASPNGPIPFRLVVASTPADAARYDRNASMGENGNSLSSYTRVYPLIEGQEETSVDLEGPMHQTDSLVDRTSAGELSIHAAQFARRSLSRIASALGFGEKSGGSINARSVPDAGVADESVEDNAPLMREAIVPPRPLSAPIINRSEATSSRSLVDSRSSNSAQLTSLAGARSHVRDNIFEHSLRAANESGPKSLGTGRVWRPPVSQHQSNISHLTVNTTTGSNTTRPMSRSPARKIATGSSSYVRPTALSLLSPHTHDQARSKVKEFRESRADRQWRSPHGSRADSSMTSSALYSRTLDNQTTMSLQNRTLRRGEMTSHAAPPIGRSSTRHGQQSHQAMERSTFRNF